MEVYELTEKERELLKKELQDRDAREHLKREIDKKLRKKLKLKKNQLPAPPPKKKKFLAVYAHEFADGDPQRALSAAVEVLRTVSD